MWLGRLVTAGWTRRRSFVRTPQFYQPRLLRGPTLSRLADGFVLRCFQHLSTQCVAARPARNNRSPEASKQGSSRTTCSFHSNHNTPSRYHTNCLATFLTQLTIPFNAWTPTPLVAYAQPG